MNIISEKSPLNFIFINIKRSDQGKGVYANMANDNGISLSDVGNLASAIPDDAWNTLVSTACDTFSKFVSPVTELTYGIGRLIQAKFDGMVDVQKVLAAQNVQRAQEKVKKSKKSAKGRPKGPVLVAAIEESANQTEETIRQLWSNLLAQELISGEVHPEFTRILSRLSSTDAYLLAAIAAESQQTQGLARILKAFTRSVILPGVGSVSLVVEYKKTYNHELLAQLHLVDLNSDGWALTALGWAFLEAVTDPSEE